MPPATSPTPGTRTMATTSVSSTGPTLSTKAPPPGANAAGQHNTYDRLPYFFSDQYDLGLEYVGHASPDDQVSVRGDLEHREFIAFWHRRDRVRQRWPSTCGTSSTISRPSSPPPPHRTRSAHRPGHRARRPRLTARTRPAHAHCRLSHGSGGSVDTDAVAPPSASDVTRSRVAGAFLVPWRRRSRRRRSGSRREGFRGRRRSRGFGRPAATSGRREPVGGTRRRGRG